VGFTFKGGERGGSRHRARHFFSDDSCCTPPHRILNVMMPVGGQTAHGDKQSAGLDPARIVCDTGDRCTSVTYQFIIG